jgi:hypothetical protein
MLELKLVPVQVEFVLKFLAIISQLEVVLHITKLAVQECLAWLENKPNLVRSQVLVHLFFLGYDVNCLQDRWRLVGVIQALAYLLLLSHDRDALLLQRVDNIVTFLLLVRGLCLCSKFPCFQDFLLDFVEASFNDGFSFVDAWKSYALIFTYAFSVPFHRTRGSFQE